MPDPSLTKRRRRQMRRRRIRLVLLALLVVVVVGAGVWAFYFSSLLTVERVQVTGVKTLSVAQVERRAQVSMGTPLVRADLGGITKRVEKLPAVLHADVSRSWPHAVHIDVTERTPVAVVQHAGALERVDDHGILFGAPVRRPHGLPTIHQAAGAKVPALAQAAEIAGALPPVIAHHVRFIEVHSLDNIVLMMASGKQVVWGSATDSAMKARIVGDLLHRKGVHQVDVSVPGRPTTR